ncbi:MAG: O-acetylhomoserine aminocarboxypropyltransferase/cysteine synthase [Bacilli bacterium]|jgi:O-acetylhomoserine (thiol)-lyase|nr:O-acetylhomoserine aminocarboxypropyltransferase/cysteine synthase [Bacilli bacterium]
MSKTSYETNVVHQYFRGDETNSIVRPIHPTTAYFFNDADHGADLFDLKVVGNIYTRLTNPTYDAFGQTIAQLEGGVAGISTASGASAISLAILALVKSGDHIIASKTIYGGSISLFNNQLKQLGIETTFIDQEASYDELSKEIKENTKLIFAETIGNPTVPVLDYEKFSALAKSYHLPLVIDNTFAPYLFKPLDYGANIVIYSATKYLGGHGNVIGGVIVDGGNFDWAKDDKFIHLTSPDDSYHGLNFYATFKEAAYGLYVRAKCLRDYGPTLSPFNAYLLSTGLQTLVLRLERHSANALNLAKYLEKHEAIEWVLYPGLTSHPNYDIASRYLTKGASGILAFGIKGGLEAGKKFINSLELGIHAVNVGDVRTIVTHPASTTHRQLNAEQLKASGIEDNLIRISVGIENIDDLIADIEQALKKSQL